MKSASIFLNVLLLTAAVYLFMLHRNTQKQMDDYQFQFHPPAFTEREIQIIKGTFPTIVMNLDNPAGFYISSVQEKNSRITVSIMPLRALQTGVNPKTGKGEIMNDGLIRFIFDRYFQLLEKKADA